MKRIIFYTFLIALFALPAKLSAQLYGNEWIDYNATYYKFKVGKEGIYRINKTTLDAAGVPTTTLGTQFKVFCEGVEVPLLVSTNATFTNNDYIEFFGQQASGNPDTALFAHKSWQSNITRSLFSDTGVYFLTVTTTGNNLRYQNVVNTISNPPPAQSFCYATSRQDYFNEFFNGEHYAGQYQIYYSEFNNGEGFAEGSRFTNQPFSVNIATPNALSTGTASIKTAVLRNTYNTTNENLKIYINNQLIADSTISYDVTKHFDVGISSSLLSSSNTMQFTCTMTGSSNFDYYGSSYISVKYPRDFNVSGLDYFKFQLDPSSSFQYLEFQNFNQNNTAPLLYDLTNNKYYRGDIAVANLTRFYIEPSFTERQLVLVAANSNQRFNTQPVYAAQFKNYALSANQGDYVIITQKNYQAVTNGRNYVQDYANYRASAIGGNRNAVVINVDDLYDQFAYGIDIHPASVRQFMRYAYNNWTVKPLDLFLIGKGVYYSKYRTYLTNSAAYGYAGNVPAYGYPGSDADYVNFLPNKLEAVNVGRLSAWTAAEVGAYLDKVKTYESAMATPALPTYETELWKKKVVHAAGGETKMDSEGFLNTLNSSSSIITDTSFGGVVYSVAKRSTNPIDPSRDEQLDSLVKNGVSLITYHGHASQSAFQISSLNFPDQFQNTPRFPHVLGLGCDVAYIFSLATMKTLGEQYLASATGGSVSIIAADNLQYAPFHQLYLPQFYKSLSQVNYRKGIGEHAKYSYNVIRSNDLANVSNFYHLESMILQGDPALQFYNPEKPDYHVAADGLSAIPANVSTDLDSFTFKIVAYNLAKAIRDTVSLKVEHINPGNQTTIINTLKIVNLFNSDTVLIKVPINATTDLGLNKYKVTIDDDNRYDEMSEMNNTATLDLFIYSDNLVPVYPQEFSIINQQNITLKASTINPFRGMARYRMEIDTTELFNSNLLQQTTVNSKGGVIKWTPSVNYRDSTVYYWRAAFDSTVNGQINWSGSSFIYLANGSEGWNQSHYYQYLKDKFETLKYSADRKFTYPTGNTVLEVYNAVYSNSGGSPWDNSRYCNITVNDTKIQTIGCPPWNGTVQVVVMDSASTALWKNSGGASGSYAACPSVSANNNVYTFEFPVNTLAGRNNAKHFLDSIPDHEYVLVKNVINYDAYDTSLANEWKADENINGIGQSLYHTLFNMGFTTLDSFNYAKPFIFFTRKNDNTYPITQIVAKHFDDSLIRIFNLPATISEGNLISTIIGPSKEWKTLKWNYSALDNKIQNDHPSVIVTGIDTNNLQTILYNGVAKDTSLNFISAVQYPHLQLQWHSLDSENRTSPQLDYWRVLYSPVPEAALNPAAYFTFTDSIQTGQMLDFSVAVENLTSLPMDSMLVLYKLIDASNITHTLKTVRYKPLPGNDTLIASLNIDASAFAGNNVFFVEANPDNDQPEQYHPNNLGYLPVKITADRKNPLIDVTFDGVHILDKDIISAKPYIKVTLKDENQYLKLDDTSLLAVSIRYPSDNDARSIAFDGNVCKFIPAHGTKNEAYIEYRPDFIEDGVYELIVNGKDKSGNTAGNTAYKISFTVENKSTITNILNYPNPFSTSTAFVFTLTGSQVPTQFKIQILTVTGKVVREITRQELGNIHVGRNITDYKWDGKDQYGQMLGNGVYFYRVVTALNGDAIEHRESGADKFYKNGYGKMYIMR